MSEGLLRENSSRAFGRYPSHRKYSLSFDFVELRFCHVAVHTACEGAGDARGCPRAAGRCATYMVRHPTGVSKAWSLSRPPCLSGTTRRSCLVGDHGERRADSTLSARVPCPTVGTTSLTGINSSVLISALRFLRAIDFEKVGVKRD